MDAPPRATVSAIAALTLAPALWAGNFVIGRSVHDATDPLTLNLLRWALATLLLLPVLLRHRADILAALRRAWAGVILLSALGVVGFNTLLYAGLSRGGAGEAAVLIGMSPLMIVAVSAVWARRAPALRAGLGGLLALAGVAAVVINDGPGTGAEGLAGPALVLLAAFVWAVYTVGLRRIPLGLRPFPALALLSLTGTLLMLPALPWLAPMDTLARPGVPLAIGYLGVGASVLAFWSWQVGVAGIGADRAGVFLNLIPAFGVALGAALLGEAVTPAKLTGLALILAGVWVAQTAGASRRAAPGRG
jgi:drug/metabolite transporter (DMT)-like permease